MLAKRLVKLICVAVIAHYPVVLMADEHDSKDQSNLKMAQSILGPVSVGVDQKLKICTTDVSAITGPPAARASETFWASTMVEVFDSKDTSIPLNLEVPDLIFSQGGGGCAEIDGSVSANSILVVLTSMAKARAHFSPIVTGQFSAQDGSQSAQVILLPIPTDSYSRRSTKTCCACAPVCGCGLCDK